LDLWLNRGVTGNTSDATVARWTRDVAERYDRGSQKRRHRVRALLVSIGITDIGAAMGTDRLGEAEANLERNMLTLSRYARASHIPIAFLEIPDPTRAPLGAPFRTRAGTPVKSFCEAQEYSEEDRAVFMATIQRIRAFMEGPLRASGAEVIDYASFLPAEYFWDSHHPSKEGYLKLGALLTRPHLRKASRRPA
jgi:lysophospholipase L1-like esterase